MSIIVPGKNSSARIIRIPNLRCDSSRLAGVSQRIAAEPKRQSQRKILSASMRSIQNPVRGDQDGAAPMEHVATGIKLSNPAVGGEHRVLRKLISSLQSFVSRKHSSLSRRAHAENAEDESAAGRITRRVDSAERETSSDARDAEETPTTLRQQVSRCSALEHPPLWSESIHRNGKRGLHH